MRAATSTASHKKIVAAEQLLIFVKNRLSREDFERFKALVQPKEATDFLPLLIEGAAELAGGAEAAGGLAAGAEALGAGAEMAGAGALAEVAGGGEAAGGAAEAGLREGAEAASGAEGLGEGAEGLGEGGGGEGGGGGGFSEEGGGEEGGGSGSGGSGSGGGSRASEGQSSSIRKSIERNVSSSSGSNQKKRDDDENDVRAASSGGGGSSSSSSSRPTYRASSGSSSSSGGSSSGGTPRGQRMSSAAPKSTTPKSGQSSSGSPRPSRVAQDEQTRKLRVAVHEAGHAVIALRTGGTARVHLFANDGQVSGQTSERRGPQLHCPPAFRHALVNVAGAIAEERFFGSAPSECSASDRANLARYAEVLGIAEDALRADLHKRVECAFDDERIWQGVLALSGALLAATPDEGTTEIDDATLRAIVPWVAS